MDDELDELLVEVRADTRGFARDMADMRGTFDNTLLDGFAMGVGFLGVLLLLGLLREGIGQGSLFADAGRLLGLPWLELDFSTHRFLIAALPPGAFVLLGLLIAARQAWLQRRTRPLSPPIDRA